MNASREPSGLVAPVDSGVIFFGNGTLFGCSSLTVKVKTLNTGDIEVHGVGLTEGSPLLSGRRPRIKMAKKVLDG